MEIKDIAVSVERLDDVRGGQVDVHNFGLQLSANQIYGGASAVGVGNSAESTNQIVAPQTMTTTNNIAALKVEKEFFGIFNSVVGGGYYPV